MTVLEISIEIIGWVGALLILAAYGLLSAGKITADTPLYQWMNFVGAIGFIINSGWNGAVPSAALNVIWALIGAVALARIFSRRRTAAAQVKSIG